MKRPICFLKVSFIDVFTIHRYIRLYIYPVILTCYTYYSDKAFLSETVSIPERKATNSLNEYY